MDTYANGNLIASAPGRLRIGIEGLYRNPVLKERLETQLSRHEAVTDVLANPLTGRLLVLFDPATRSESLLQELGIDMAPPQAGSAGAAAAAAPEPTAAAAAAQAADANRREPYPPWHLREADEALAFHASSSSAGLSRIEAEERLRHGENRIALPQGRSAGEILLDQFKGAPIALLGVSAAVSLLTGAIAEAAAISAVLAMNAAIGYTTERQAEATITSLSELVDDQALVLRDGTPAAVDAAHLVDGDILLLGPGARIAADVRLLASSGLKVDESALTGESLPVDKEASALGHPVPLAERRNMAYRGTVVVGGTGLGLVVGTGQRTEAGAIDILTRSTERRRTPLELQLDRLGNQLLAVSIVMCLGVIAVGLLRGQQRGALLRAAVALAVAAVPEGLPATATTSLAKGLRRMRDRHVLMRHLYAVETASTISTICLDKTGTLTLNRMSAVDVRTLRQRHAAGPDGIEPAVHSEALERLLQVCVLCNEVQANRTAFEASAQGSATETALLELAERGGVDLGLLRKRFPLLGSELRAEGRKHMRTIHASADSGRKLVAVKGSPEEVLGLCTQVLDDGQARACDDSARSHVLQQNDEMARAQLRVLGFAYAELASEDADSATVPLTWLGLAGLADPLRPGAQQMIQRFHQAGIRTTMLTGDQAATAYEIGKSLGLNNGGDLLIINSDELDRMAPAQLNEMAGQAHIFSRVTPADKLRIVQAIQGAGEVVAMTGDGINDSPALRAADVGIAMGSGTDAALSVADVALKYDQLDSLLDAVAQGRTISDNIRKSVHFLVSSNLSEILVVFGAVAFGAGTPLSPLQLLWLNLLTDLLPAIALAEEPAESDVLQRPPRNPRENLIRKQDVLRYARESVLLAAGALSAHAYGVLRYGSGARATTIAFNTLVSGQLAHAHFCRSERHRSFSKDVPPNPRLSSAVGIASLLQTCAHLVPGLRRLLGLTALGPLDLLAIAAGAWLPLLANEMARDQSRDQSKAASSPKAERSTNLSTITPTNFSATPSNAEPAGAPPPARPVVAGA
jgi:Ca2+-transporting ATPase